MYTVEFDYDSVVTTTLDETDSFEDVELILGEDMTVFMRQWCEEMGEYQILFMSYQQLLDLLVSMHSPEGAYRTELQGENT